MKITASRLRELKRQASEARISTAGEVSSSSSKGGGFLLSLRAHHSMSPRRMTGYGASKQWEMP
jgi:hypothetical protein